MVLKVYYTAVQVPNLTDGCDTDWVAADDASCISIHDDILLGWHEAESQCGRFGGNLAYVTSASIQEAIDAAITNRYRSTDLIGCERSPFRSKLQFVTQPNSINRFLSISLHFL